MKEKQKSEISEIRKNNLLKLSKTYKSQREMADAIGMSPAQLGHLLTGFRGVGEKLARKIESQLRISSMSLDIPSEEYLAETDNAISNLIEPVSVTAEELGVINLLRELTSIQRRKLIESAKEFKNENRVAFNELGHRYGSHAHA